MARFESCFLCKVYCVWLTWSSFSHVSPHSAVLCIGSWKGAAAMPVLWPLLGHALILLPTVSPSPVGWGWARSWGGTQPRQLTKTDRKDIPYRMVPAQK